MRADQIGARGRVGSACALSVSTSGRLSSLLGKMVKDFIHAFLAGEIGEGFVKIFEAVAEMDRVFTGTAEM